MRELADAVESAEFVGSSTVVAAMRESVFELLAADAVVNWLSAARVPA